MPSAAAPLALILSIAAITAVVPIASVPADEPAPRSAAERKERVAQLLRHLNAASRQLRENAERELLALGPDILPDLPPPELLPNASVREAVRRIRISLERTKARESVQPSRVTLEKKAPLEDLLKAIETQTGNRIDLTFVPASLRQQVLAADYDQQPFWPVMDDLAARAKLRFHFGSGKQRLAVLPPAKPPQPNAPRPDGEQLSEVAVTYSGPFRLAVISAAERPLFGDEDRRLLRVRFGLTAEPRLRPLFLKFTGRDITASTPAKQVLAPLNPDASYELPLGEGGQHLEFTVDFKVPVAQAPSSVRRENQGAGDSSAKRPSPLPLFQRERGPGAASNDPQSPDRIVRPTLAAFALKGRLMMQTAAGTEEISFADLEQSAGVARRRGGVTVTLMNAAFRKTDADDHNLAVRVGVSYDTGGPAFESHRTWIFHNDVRLETKDGRRLELNGGFDTELQSDGGVAVTYRFRGLKEPPGDYRFIYVAPTLIINVPVEFEFAKVPVTPLAK